MLCHLKQTGSEDSKTFHRELEEFMGREEKELGETSMTNFYQLEEFMGREENKMWGETFCKKLS